MLNRVDAGTDGRLDPLVPMRVGSDLQAQPVAFFHDDVHLFVREVLGGRFGSA